MGHDRLQKNKHKNDAFWTKPFNSPGDYDKNPGRKGVLRVQLKGRFDFAISVNRKNRVSILDCILLN